jgi:hypothetical protein
MKRTALKTKKIGDAQRVRGSGDRFCGLVVRVPGHRTEMYWPVTGIALLHCIFLTGTWCFPQRFRQILVGASEDFGRIYRGTTKQSAYRDCRRKENSVMAVDVISETRTKRLSKRSQTRTVSAILS